MRILVNQVKSVPCMDCGQSYPPFVMDFDHREPNKKLANMTVIVNQKQSWRLLHEEIAKCDVVCSNCHRFRTMGVVARQVSVSKTGTLGA